MSRNVLTISKILRSVNNLKENGDIGKIDDQSTMKAIGSSILEEEYTSSISDLNISALTTSSIFIRSNSSILKISRKIV